MLRNYYHLRLAGSQPRALETQDWMNSDHMSEAYHGIWIRIGWMIGWYNVANIEFEFAIFWLVQPRPHKLRAISNHSDSSIIKLLFALVAALLFLTVLAIFLLAGEAMSPPVVGTLLGLCIALLLPAKEKAPEPPLPPIDRLKPATFAMLDHGQPELLGVFLNDARQLDLPANPKCHACQDRFAQREPVYVWQVLDGKDVYYHEMCLVEQVEKTRSTIWDSRTCEVSAHGFGPPQAAWKPFCSWRWLDGLASKWWSRWCGRF